MLSIRDSIPCLRSGLRGCRVEFFHHPGRNQLVRTARDEKDRTFDGLDPLFGLPGLSQHVLLELLDDPDNPIADLSYAGERVLKNEPLDLVV